MSALSPLCCLSQTCCWITLYHMGEVPPTLWMTTVLAKGPSSSKDNSSTLQCFRWNESKFALHRRRFAHVCPTCKGAHKKSAYPTIMPAKPTDRLSSPTPKKSTRRWLEGIHGSSPTLPQFLPAPRWHQRISSLHHILPQCHGWILRIL